MSTFTVTLNAELINEARRPEAEAIVKSYFPYSHRLHFDYLEATWPIAILEFPRGAFGSIEDWSEIALAFPRPPKDAGELIKPHVEAELMTMLSTKPRKKAPSSYWSTHHKDQAKDT